MGGVFVSMHIWKSTDIGKLGSDRQGCLHFWELENNIIHDIECCVVGCLKKTKE